MAQLPATYREAVEAEALAFARGWIADHRKPNDVFHSSAEEIYGKELMKHWIQFYPSFGPDEIVYFAEKGSQQADLALRELFAECEQRGETPPSSVRAYIIRVLNPARAGKKPGPGKAALFVRDIGIMLLVVELNKKFGLSFFKNFGSHRPTASSIAATALTKAGIGVSFGPAGVEKVWRRFGPIYTGHFPTAYLGPYPDECRTSSIPNLDDDNPA
jgi:hypothetical protein